MKRNGQGQIKTCCRKQHVKSVGMKGIPNLFCGIFVAGRNYNLTRDNKVHKPYLAKFDKNGNKGRKHE